MMAVFCVSTLGLKAELKPLMVKTVDKVVDESFAKPLAKLPKTQWLSRQGTRWSFEGGVLKGLPSSAEYQASKSHHRGTEARLSIPPTPAEFAASFRFRFIKGSETVIVPFVEFGHHVCRIRFSKKGTELLADGETMRVAEASDLKWESGKWYSILAELKGEEFVVQFENGLTLYARHATFGKPNPSGGNGVGFACPKGGTAEVDDMIIWSVAPSYAKGWKQTKAELPVFKHVQVKEKKPKKK